MHAFYAFGLIILIAFLGSRFAFRRRSQLSPLNFILLSGIVYLFLGLYLGEMGSGILSEKALADLSPIINFSLGWIGFLFGFQLEHRYLRRFPKNYLGLSLFQSLSVILFGFFGSLFALWILLPATGGATRIGMAVAFGLLISLNSPTLLNAAAFSMQKKGRYYYLARFLVSVSGFWALLGLSVVTSFWHFPVTDSRSFGQGSALMLISTAFPVLLGWMFHLLTRHKTPEPDLLVYLLGLVFFVSGASFTFHFPPLYVCMVLGITFSNLTKKQENIYRLLLSTEKPLYIILLILIGALWKFNFGYEIALMVGILILVRGLGYALSFPVFEKLFGFQWKLPPKFGLSFLSFGGIGVAFAVSLHQIYSLPESDYFLSAALLAIFLSEILSPAALRILLSRIDSEEWE